jgi:hypothetical protein
MIIATVVLGFFGILGLYFLGKRSRDSKILDEKGTTEAIGR